MIKTYKVEGLSCAACAISTQKMLSRIDGVQTVRVNYASATAVLEMDHEIELELLNQKINKAGYNLYPKSKDALDKQRKIELKKIKVLKTELFVAALLAIPLFIIAMFLHAYIPHQTANLIMFFLTVPIMFFSGRRFFVSAWKQLLIGQTNMDTLVALGTGAAFLYSIFNTFYPHYLTDKGIEAHVYYETSGVLIFFILLGKYFEQIAKKKTSAAIEGLLSMNVQELNILIDGVEKKIPIEAALTDDIVIVRPGDKIPLDGFIVIGESEVDESMLNGEPMPKFKKMADNVFAGTINLNGFFHFKVTKMAEDTVLAQMIRLVETAQSSASPIQKTVDKISSYFVPAVIGISVLVAIIWLLAGPEPRLAHAIISAVTVLVISCPCALGLATPTAIMVGIGVAAQKGILIKAADSLQSSAQIDVILFDKTGTLTEGKPVVNNIKTFKDSLTILPLLASIEHRSDHPISKAICAFLKDYDNNIVLSNFENLSGKGLIAQFNDQHYFAGNLKLLTEHQIILNAEQELYIESLGNADETLVFFADQSQVLAIITLSDKIKSSSVQAIRALKSSNVEVYMLTGDNAKAAKSIAKEIEIEKFEADLLPADKIAFVKKIQASGRKVAMVGDGINDAPALAQADLGIAMNSGTNIAVESADVVLLNNNLNQIAEMIQISKKTMRILRQNLFWAFIYNVLGIPIAAGILYPFWGILLDPMIAGAAMAFSSVSVVLNSLRIYNLR